MAADPNAQDPAEGSREIIDRELERREARAKPQGDALSNPIAPGDDAAAGTPGTGEDVCPDCHGTGILTAKPCPKCEGTGRVIKAIGGA